MKSLQTWLRAITLSLVFAALSTAAGRAQEIERPVKAGACTVTVKLAAPVGADTEVVLELNKKALPALPTNGQALVTLVLKAPLTEGDVLRARRKDGSTVLDGDGTEVTVEKGEGPPECQARPAPERVGDGREPWVASAYAGEAIDNFAPASVGGYANPEAGGKQNRFVGGFDFEFRVAGRAQSKRQVWIYGETLHGVRTADVNCAPENTDKPAVCGKLTEGNPSGKLQYVLENATSMEAFAGLRVELLTLQSDTNFPAKFYVNGRFGVMMLNGEVKLDGPHLDVNHAYRADHVSVGLLMPKSAFAGSYLEVGWGRTQLFDNPRVTNHWRRLKIDAHLSFALAGPMRGFAQLYSDFDPSGESADSIQTFFGLDFDVGEFFKFK